MCHPFERAFSETGLVPVVTRVSRETRETTRETSNWLPSWYHSLTKDTVTLCGGSICMKRATLYLLYLLFILLAYVSAWIGFYYCKQHEITGINQDIYLWYLQVAPLYTLVAIGSVLLGKLGWDLIRFNDYPDEIKKLEEDIALARKDLTKRGFKFK